MARRIRTAKKLGTRHDLNYFKRLTASLRWRRILSFALPAFFVLWLFTSGVVGNQLPYSSGPVAKAHSVFATQCAACHASMVNGVKTVGFKNNATDEACMGCHQAPAHQANQPFTPTCGSCHVEHRGTVQLTHTADSNCVRCHSNLTTKSGTPHFERTIFNFTSRHPEFAPLRKDARDPGTISFNHYLHVHTEIVGPKGRVKLVCDDCHRTPADSSRPWRFSDNLAKGQAASLDALDIRRPSSGRAYMLPVTYASSCAACHQLQFDAQSAEAAPHDKPEIVHAFVVDRLRKLLAGGAGSVKPAAFTRPIPGSAHSASAEVGRGSFESRLRDDEQLLWRKTCNLCHALDFRHQSPSPTGVSLPTVAASNITKIWFPNAMFTHYAHQAFSCESCHRAALTSQETGDVLLPGIKSCQKCHNSPGASKGAENGCFLCHLYHDWKEPGKLQPTHSIELTVLRKSDWEF